MIDVENLTKEYAGRIAVDNISFKVKRGEVIGFLGPNGAGKSTTLRILTAYLAPTQGSVRVGGIDAIKDPIGARRQIGYMPESVPLYREMRVEEYLRYRARLKGVPRSQVKSRLSAALEAANITDVQSRIIGQLSKGYRSRVGLADALVADPPLLVLDEPTAGLDPNQIRQVRDLIRGMAGAKTVLLSTHILPEVESTCGRVMIINKGRIVGEGAPGELRIAEKGGQVLVLEARGDRLQLEAALSAVPGVNRILDSVVLATDLAPPLVRLRLDIDKPIVAEAVFAASAAGNFVLREMRREQTSLEDVFASLTTADLAADSAEDVPAGPPHSQAAAPPMQDGEGESP